MTSTQTNPRILLTGGSGFLGKAIVRELCHPGSPLQPSLIRILDLAAYQGPADNRIEMVTGDICHAEDVGNACRGIDLVIHTAALVDWGTKPGQEVLSVNFSGTENVVRACLEHQVKHLVYTSSLDAIFGGKSLVDIDESIPYPQKHPNMYCRSKYLSEKLVLEVNDHAHRPADPNAKSEIRTLKSEMRNLKSDFRNLKSEIRNPKSEIRNLKSEIRNLKSNGLTTCVLRPADIYGEGDPYHIGSLINMAKGGFYVRLGDGSSKSQHVYAGNMAWAHVLAATALLDGNPAIAGQAYFITDGPPANFFTFFDRIVEGAGYPIRPKNIWIPRRIAFVMGLISEGVALMARPVYKYAPKFSRFAVTYTCSDFTFTSVKAQNDFGFKPKYSAEEAFHRTVDYYRRQDIVIKP